MAILVALSALACSRPAVATTLVWDANGSGTGTGGTGTWDTTSSLWRLNTDTGTLQTYTSATSTQANFDGTAGTVTIGSGTTISVGTIVFSTSGYTIAGASGTAQLSFGSSAGAITTGAGDIETISAIIAGTDGLTKNNDSGTLILSGADTFTGGISINGGTLQLATGGSLVNTNNLTTSGTGSTFDINGVSQTLAKVTNGTGSVITNSSATQATLTIGDGSAGSGNYTGNMNVIWNQSATNSTIGGNFTNTGNLNINVVGSQAANISGLVNNAGTVTLGGSASVTCTLSGGIGSNVTAITQTTNGSPLNITTGALTVNSAGTTLTDNSAGGAGTMTVSAGVSGTGNLTLNNNSSITSGITLSSALINNAGTITNSGTGSSSNSTLISAPIGASVTGIIENSAHSLLQLSGANNAFTGSVTVTAGTLQYGSNDPNALNFNNVVSVAPGATFDFNNSAAIIAGLNGTGGTVTNSGSANSLTLAGSGNYSYSGVVTGSNVSSTALTVSLTGGGSQTLSGANTYNGTSAAAGVATTLTGGTLKINAGAGGSLASSGAMTFAGLATFNYDNTTASLTLSQSLGTLEFGSGDGTVQLTRTAAQNVTLTYSSLATELAVNSSIVGGTGNFIVNGTGVTNGTNAKIVLTGVTTNAPIRSDIYFGGSNYAYYDSAGFVRGINWGSSDTNQKTTAGGATLGTTTQTQYVQMTGPVTAQTNANVFNLNISGANNLAFSNSSQTLTFGNGNNNVVAGILKSGGGAASIGTTTVPGALALNGANDAYMVRVDSASDTLTINAQIQGAGGTSGFTKSGAGTLVLTGLNTWSGITFFNGGILSFSNVQNQGNNSNLGRSSNTIDEVLNGGTALWTGGSTNNSTNTPWGVGSGGGTIDAEGTGPLNITNGLQFFGTPNISGGAETLTLTGASTQANTISGSLNNGSNGNIMSLTKTGAGLWVMGSNSYTGPTTMSGGVFEASSSTTLSGGVGSSGGTSNLTFNGGVFGIGFSGTTFARPLGGLPAQVQFTGSGGFAAYGSSVTVNLGGSSAGVTWNSGSFVPAGSSLILGASTANNTLTFANPINFNGTARTVQVVRGTGSPDAVLSGALTGTGASGLTVTGNGILQLTQNAGVNTYTGNTTVNGGTLQLAPVTTTTNNIASSAQISVASGATLDATGLTSSTLALGTNQILAGNGNVLGSVSATSGNHIAPMNAAGPSAIGTLAISSGLTLGSGSILDYTLGSTGNSSLTTVGAALTLPASSGTVTFNITDNAGAGSLGSVGPGNYKQGHLGGLPPLPNFTSPAASAPARSASARPSGGCLEW